MMKSFSRLGMMSAIAMLGPSAPFADSFRPIAVRKRFEPVKFSGKDRRYKLRRKRKNKMAAASRRANRRV